MPRKYHCNIIEIAEDLSMHTIIVNLHDILKKRHHNLALAWFHWRNITPFGYGWCLNYFPVNPNLVRKIIKRFCLLYKRRLAAELKLKDKKMRSRQYQHDYYLKRKLREAQNEYSNSICGSFAAQG